MSRLARMAVALLLCSAAVVACGDDGTSLFLRVTDADGATQLRVRGVRGEEPWFGPVLAPETEGEPFSGEQTLRIRFTTPPDAPGLVEVDALEGGEVIARGSAEAAPRKGEEVELRIGLSRVTVEPGTDGGTDGGTDAGTDGGDPDAGTPDGGDPDAGLPDAGLPDAGLPDAGAPDAGGGDVCAGCPGCCRNNVCVNPPSVNNCGVGGEQCNECPEGRADRCTQFGGCSCGENAGVCPVGQRCSGARCICDAASCPDGCCSAAGACLPGDSNSSCGNAGSLCTSCPILTSCRSNGSCG
ncbi:MAG TPA: hypothetical protein VE153_31930 [Myxococcus sp.]|nr:hypothetical protein [Myxococcus sp.]